MTRESVPLVGYVSLAIPGKPLIVIADPLGKTFACVNSAQMYANWIPGDSFSFKRIAPADMNELAELHARLVQQGHSALLAKREWFEVVTD